MPMPMPASFWPNGAGGGWKPPTNEQTSPRTMTYAELHTHSNFSFLDGASHPEELAAEAVRLGLSALALTDHDGLYGAVRFAEAARAFGLPTVFGAELTLTSAGTPAPPRTGVPDPDGTHLVVLARNPGGYARLSRGIAEAHLAGGEKGKPIITLDNLANRHDGHWQILTGCRKGALAAALTTGGPAAAARVLDQLIDRFGRDRIAVELWDHGDPIDTTRNDTLALLATERGVTPVATNNVHYAVPARFPWPPRWLPYGPGNLSRTSRAGSPLHRAPAYAVTQSRNGDSPAGPGRWNGRRRSPQSVPSICAWWHHGYPTFQYRPAIPNRPG